MAVAMFNQNIKITMMVIMIFIGWVQYRDTPQNVGNLAFRGKTSKIEQDSTK
jgi:hypothetical protein